MTRLPSPPRRTARAWISLLVHGEVSEVIKAFWALAVDLILKKGQIGSFVSLLV